MNMQIKVVEVGPRDGLQNEKKFVPTEIKIEFINHLIAAGLRTIEATSFVSARKIPQMADHQQLITALPRHSFVHFPVLVPNLQGFDNAVRLGVKEIAVFAAASESFSERNINRSIIDSLNEYTVIIQQALEYGIKVRGYISCVLGCPYEGVIPLSQVVKVALAFADAGCYEISLGDTIGVGTPKKAAEMVKAVASQISISKLALHFHDTYGQALANILACLELGITTVDASAAGLGGCPYAKGATGNVATEEVVYMLHGMGLKTGIELTKLIEAGERICQYLGRPNRSKVATTMMAKNQ